MGQAQCAAAEPAASLGPQDVPQYAGWPDQGEQGGCGEQAGQTGASAAEAQECPE